MNKVWVVIEQYDYEGSEIFEVFGDEDSANEMLELIKESQADRLTDDELVKCPFGNADYFVEEWEVNHQEPSEICNRLKNEQWVQVERLRQMYSSPQYIEAQRLAQERADEYKRNIDNARRKNGE